MKIAFYAPLKPPQHPVPSGDRQIARALLEALSRGGHESFVVSRFRTFDAHGDAERQSRLDALGRRIAQRVIARHGGDGARPDVWFTYHVHHKAPDLLGPPVSAALGIPYVVAEASLAPRQQAGRWALGHSRALAAIRAADCVLFVNPRDVACVRAVREPGALEAALPPFIDVREFAPADARLTREPAPLRVLTIAMMREGAKLASYRALAAALAQLSDLSWELAIVGDGPARRDVEGLFAGFAQRVRFLGAKPHDELAPLYRASDLFVWPAVDEAIGIVFLEAQACGIPVIGADTPGVAGAVADGRTGILVPPEDTAELAAAIRTFADDARLRERLGRNASLHVRERHDIGQAATRLDAVLRQVVDRYRRASVSARSPRAAPPASSAALP